MYVDTSYTKCINMLSTATPTTQKVTLLAAVFTGWTCRGTKKAGTQSPQGTFGSYFKMLPFQ